MSFGRGCGVIDDDTDEIPEINKNIKQNRLIISCLIRRLTEDDFESNGTKLKLCVEILNNYEGNFLELYDEEKNTSKYNC